MAVSSQIDATVYTQVEKSYLKLVLNLVKSRVRSHLLLMWRFYSANCKALFSLVRSLDIHSTSADESVIDALKFVLDNEQS